MNNKKPFHEQVAEKLIKQLEQGTAPWQKPWGLGQTAKSLLPYNPVTGNRYRGINALNLMSESDTDNRWLTYRQAESIGAQVRRGEKGTQVQYWQFTEKIDKRDENGQIVIGSNGKPEKVEVPLERPRVFFATVFNASQIDNMPPLQVDKNELDWNPIERAENILRESKAVINHDQIDSAYYKPSTDQIHMPFKDSFPDAASYYAVALHELGHWTGHESRLNRDIKHPFGSEGYAKEELRAEIASMMVGLELGIGYDPSNHASYVAGWIKVLQDDPKEILRAASDSEKIFEFVLSHERKQEINVEIEKTPMIEPLKKIEKIYLDVPYGDKEEAKALGAKWDRQEKSWYYIGEENAEKFAKWAGKKNNLDQEQHQEQSNEIKDVPYEIADKVYLDVPYGDKEEAKALGAKWDAQEKSWYIDNADNRDAFERWINEDKVNDVDFEEIINERNGLSTEEKVYIAVPYDDRNEAKALGAKWDAQEKSWYRNANDDKEKFAKWEINPAKDYQAPPIDPREEFRQAMQAMNIEVIGMEHPIDDGKWHRMKTNDDARGKKSASYKFYSDGRPAGVINNFKTGEVVKWVSKGYVLSDEEKSRLAAISAEKNKERELQRINEQNIAADKAKNIISNGSTVNIQQEYLTRKGIEIEKGIYMDSKNNLLVPMQDVNNNIRNVQTIYGNGTKLFVKEAQKTGAFHVLGQKEGCGREAIQKAQNVVFAEGYATAASIKQTINDKNTAYIVAFDAGNLRSVVENVINEFPDKNYLIAGDDDKHLTMREKPEKNVGVIAATKVAEEFGISAVFPNFPKEEFVKNPKALTDFNDLMKLENGREILSHQINAAFNNIKQNRLNVANENQHKQERIKRAI